MQNFYNFVRGKKKTDVFNVLENFHCPVSGVLFKKQAHVGILFEFPFYRREAGSENETISQAMGPGKGRAGITV